MDWQNALWIVGIGLVFWMMMRGCGGMGGGCGMGGRGRDTDARGSEPTKADDTKQGGHRAA